MSSSNPASPVEIIRYSNTVFPAVETEQASQAQQGTRNGREATQVPPQKSLFQRAWQTCVEAPGNIKKAVKVLKRDVNALTIAMGKPECPLSAKIVAGATVAYALSPIDLIPDCIPILGYLDDIIIVPAGIMLSIQLLPPGMMDQCRQEAEQMEKQKKSNWKAAVVIGALWVVSAYFTINVARKMFF